jgi:TPR repeat protein
MHRLALRPALGTVWLALCFAAMVFAGGCGRSSADAEELFKRGDYADALPLWHQRADKGDATAQNYLGVSYHLGLGVQQDYKEAAKWYTMAAENGSVDAQRNLGTMYYHGYGVPQDNGLAYGWYYVASRNGNTLAEDSRQSMMDEMTPNHCRLSEKRIKEYLENKGILKRVMVNGQLDDINTGKE